MNAEQITTMREQAIAQMESLLATSGPTITVNDEEIPWAPLLAALERTVDWCDRKLTEYLPYEVRSAGET
jgi:protein-disulfide isomerase